MTQSFEIRILGYTAKEATVQLTTIAKAFSDKLSADEPRYCHPQQDDTFTADPSDNSYAGHFTLAAGQTMPDTSDILRVLECGNSAPHAIIDIGEQGNITIQKDRVKSTNRANALRFPTAKAA